LWKTFGSCAQPLPAAPLVVHRSTWP
jgi:hypothetical protein